MLSSELDYELPDDRIAQYPTEARDGARLMVVKPEAVEHRMVREFCELVPEGSLLVLNDSRVMRARVHAQRAGGGKVELLFLRASTLAKVDVPGSDAPLTAVERSGDDAATLWEVLARSNKPLQPGMRLTIAGESNPGIQDLSVQDLSIQDLSIEVVKEGTAGSKWVRCSRPAEAVMAACGRVPLPPYIQRDDLASDRERYQTVFSRSLGSAAAPTAGLHLTQAALARLAERGVEIGYVTLHVGAGTFRPVTSERVEEHSMHEEHYEISEELAEQVRGARRRGSAIIAVGTTVVRCLESASVAGEVSPGKATTRLMITPGYRFDLVDGLLTNFHAPRSTLLALVKAFAGREVIQQAYAKALAEGYRFLSYGDAMWLPSRAGAC